MLNPTLIKTALFLLLALMLLAFFQVTGNPLIYFTYQVLPGQSLYVISKLCALLALFGLCVQTISGLLGNRFYELLAIHNKTRFHLTLGLTTLFLVIGHVALFVTAVSIRNGHMAWNLLRFNWGDFYSAMLSLGLVSLILLLVGTFIRLIKTMPELFSRWLHRINMIAFVLILIHASQVGTETRFATTGISILILLSVVVLAFILRLMRWRQQSNA